MNYFYLLFLFVFLSRPIMAENSDAWINSQWDHLPVEYRVDKPTEKIEIDSTDRKFLNTKLLPIQRNRYANKTYNLLGKEFSKCLGVENRIGNWFYYASWASLSAGEIISGQKYKQLGLWDNFWVNLLQKSHILGQKKEMNEIFSTVNTSIAIEMIPLGKSFLNYFCQEEKKSWTEFESLLLSGKNEQKLLIKAFKLYHDAIYEKNIKKRVEMITLASTLQVFSEQMRVDSPLKLVFKINYAPDFLKNIIIENCTKVGNYTMENKNEHIFIRMSNDINQKRFPPELKQIDYPLAQKFYQQEGILDDDRHLNSKDTATKNWGNLKQRKKFLAAMFWAYIGAPALRGEPHPEFAEYQTLREWNSYLKKIEPGNL